ncbi:ATP-binding protein [Azospirillum doebereinerae]|uniref:hybrid sensor histidine kinase/response regulator n=1 Tax=Azospirillum doebereinerae TaxID=92933 RepID=UPI001EE59441|nr:hybrid sensor histidine kinase/response regulator [Azospirillum doebereinerae]MCG5241666.1 ATP-binding protein [Azospirillum doebereinerae]
MTLQPLASETLRIQNGFRPLWSMLKAKGCRRRWLSLALLPLAAYVLLLLAAVSYVQSQMLHERLNDQLEKVSDSVQQILAQEIAYLSGIAISKTLDAADLDGFRVAAELAWRERPAVYTIVLNDEDQQLLNLRLGKGRKPPIWEADSLKRVWATGKPAVGDLVNGMFAVRVPVLRDGKVRYVLSEILDPQMFNNLLHAEFSAKGWIAALIDRRLTILARSENAERFVGLSPTSDIVRNIRTGRTGLEKVITKDGIPSYGAVVPLGGSGWYLGIGIPESVAEASYQSTRWLLIGGGGALLVVMIAFGLWIGWRSVGMLEDKTEVLSANLVNAHRESDEKSTFLAVMSHELRTPLTGIIGFSELLTNSGLDEQQKEWVLHQRIAGRHLMAIINDILDYSKAQAGGIRLEVIDFDVVAMLEEAMALSRPMADAKDLALVIGETSGTARWLQGDPTRLQQVVNNFLSNALKFTAKGEVRLSMGQESIGESRILLKITVQDTGIGVPADQQGRLFKRFNQANSAVAREYGGTGLGLSICKSLVELMGGTIGFESVAGQGSAFWFSVPLAVGSEPVKNMVETVDCAPADSGPRARILLVEDSRVNQFLTRTILERDGYRVALAADGAEAVDKIQRDRFDLVLMDVHLPVLDGVGATRAIRALGDGYARIPIWALTGSVVEEDIRSCLSAGMDGHLAKPFLPKDLLSIVKRSLEQRRSSGAAPNPPTLDPEMYRAMVSSLGQEKMDELQAVFFDWLRSAKAEFPDPRTDWNALHEEAHRFIGSAGMFGYFRIVEAARELCQACQSLDSARVERSHARLLAEVDAACETQGTMRMS